MRKLVQKQIIPWLAIVAILMGALAPTISKALTISQNHPTQTVEICTITGFKVIYLEDNRLDGSDSSGNLQEKHCSYCLAHSVVVVLINQTLSFVSPQKHIGYSSVFYRSPKPLIAWLNLPSRAPPSIS